MNRKNWLTAFKVALVVGTVLNLINQFQFPFSLDIQNISFGKLTLNYFVPFIVSLYSASAAEKRNGKI